MRITRAYTITPEVKRILDTKPNKSEYICRAVRRLHIQEDDFTLLDIETNELLRTLVRRAGCPVHIKAVIRDYLDKESTS